MMDAYEIQQKILSEWRRLALASGADTIKKIYNDVPVLVKVNGKIYTVNDVLNIDGKILLEVADE